MEAVRGFVKGDERGAIRALGGILLAVAAIVIIQRRTATFDPWGSLPVFLVLLAPTAFLLATGYLGGRQAGAVPTGWQVAYTVLGLVLLPFTLFAGLDWLGGDTNSSWNTAWIFALVAIAAFACAQRAGVRVGCLIGGLALLVVWLSIWDELLSDGLGADAGTVRGLLVIAGVLLAGLAAYIAAGRWPEGSASDMVTVAGIAFVTAGGISLGDSASFFTPARLPVGVGTEGAGTSTLWELELAVASLLIVLYGTGSATRGPTYIGGIGLFAFAFVVGVDLNNPEHNGSLVGWPLVLLIVALALLALASLPAVRRRD